MLYNKKINSQFSALKVPIFCWKHRLKCNLIFRILICLLVYYRVYNLSLTNKCILLVICKTVEIYFLITALTLSFNNGLQILFVHQYTLAFPFLWLTYLQFNCKLVPVSIVHG